MSNFITRKSLPRRTFLKGVGAAVALPFLDAMSPAMAAPARTATGRAPMRMAVAYIPNGVVIEDWIPTAEGIDYEIPRLLKGLESHRERVLVLSGLNQHNAQALGDGGGDHARAAATFLTGVHPRKTAGADIKNGISMDQVASEHLGHRTRLASLELSCNRGKLAGDCDSGYSCAYSNSISWRTETTPNPPEHNPRAVFERLFGRADSDTDPAVAAAKRARRGSILDYVLEDTHRLQRKLGEADRRKVDEYLYAVRNIEQQIEFANEHGDVTVADDIDIPEGVPKEYSEYVRLMFDLQVLAFQTDQTRIITFMLGNEGSNRTYKELGISNGHHELTHHLGDEAKIEDVRKINEYHVNQFAYFLDKLDSVEDGDGTLLDHSMITFGSGIGDGNRHNHDNLPIILAGGGGGTIKTGRHIAFPEKTPMNNLYLSMLDRMGIPTEFLGDSTGKLEQLSGI
ncbi:MAG: hypothetical protein DHS20C16_37650 [Phycisphaerae bacterium]|nr:MAG: hypothetical protein DHS20C16_37650 [Phycisphaerae bacterium]